MKGVGSGVVGCWVKGVRCSVGCEASAPNPHLFQGVGFGIQGVGWRVEGLRLSVWGSRFGGRSSGV